MKDNRDYCILDEINHFADNGLDDEEAEILRDAIKKIREKHKAESRASGESGERSRSRKIVASWPQWKQDMARQILRP